MGAISRGHRGGVESLDVAHHPGGLRDPHGGADRPGDGGGAHAHHRVGGQQRSGRRVTPLDRAAAAAVRLPDDQDGPGGVRRQIRAGRSGQGDRGRYRAARKRQVYQAVPAGRPQPAARDHEHLRCPVRPGLSPDSPLTGYVEGVRIQPQQHLGRRGRAGRGRHPERARRQDGLLECRVEAPGRLTRPDASSTRASSERTPLPGRDTCHATYSPVAVTAT
jgi:hypothetical protein